MTVPTTKAPFSTACCQSRLPLTPSTLATTPLPNPPAAAPKSQQYQNGLGGSSSANVVDRYVYDPKQKNNLDDCAASALPVGTLPLTNDSAHTSPNPPTNPPAPPCTQIGSHDVAGCCCSCLLTRSNAQKRTPARPASVGPWLRAKDVDGDGGLTEYTRCRPSSIGTVDRPAKAPVAK